MPQLGFCVLCSMHVAVAVTNDLSTDQRVQRTIDTLQSLGANVTFIGRELPSSQPFNPGYSTKRFKLPFRKGAAFYAAYNLRLFIHLLFNKYDVYLANDLDTLLAIGLASKLKGVPFVYDSHEFFTGVPEIQDRPAVVKTWKSIEKRFYHKAVARITVNQSIADLLAETYGGDAPYVVRNIGKRPDSILRKTRAELGLPEDKFIAINQGAGINVDRGMEEAVDAIAKTEEMLLLIVGNGDAVPALKKTVAEKGIEDKVKFVDKVPYRELLAYTALADVGLSLDKPTSINYKFSLPNKLFDYIHSNIPVITSGVVEVKRVVETYGVGKIVDPTDPADIRKALEHLKQNGRAEFEAGLQKAQQELTWDQERKVLAVVFTPLLKEQK